VCPLIRHTHGGAKLCSLVDLFGALEWPYKIEGIVRSLTGRVLSVARNGPQFSPWSSAGSFNTVPVIASELAGL